VLLLAAWEGLKPREIAKVTNSTANVVRVRLHHARQQLARELRPAGVTSAEQEPESPRTLPVSGKPSV
jgi:RNA polymerase sigma-70 factor (ECF subfamily)